jgi:membrane-anchored glycerophosphoryl diester phosphodiesterase (GDPDase)
MEEIGDLIGKGFRAWKGNLNLCIPFLLSAFFSLLALLPFLSALIDVFSQKNLNSLPPAEWMPIFEEALPGLAPYFLASLFLLMLFGSFFFAGAIGMAGQALQTGKASTGALWSCGRKNLVNLFLNTLLVDLIMAAGLLFLLPWGLVSAYISDTTTMALLLAGVLLLILYALSVSLILALSPYALVVDGLGPLQALRASATVFRQNKFDVLLIWLIILALAMGLQMLGGWSSADPAKSLQPLAAIAGALNIMVISPLSTLWWTRLYLSRTFKLKEEVKSQW